MPNLTNSMNNLEKIKAAWSMGWSATLNDRKHNWHILGFDKTNVHIYNGNEGASIPNKWVNDYQITGYLYAGELAGNEPIPEGQKFRVKTTEQIIKAAEYQRLGNERVEIDRNEGLEDFYYKSELEPVFD